MSSYDNTDYITRIFMYNGDEGKKNEILGRILKLSTQFTYLMFLMFDNIYC